VQVLQQDGKEHYFVLPHAALLVQARTRTTTPQPTAVEPASRAGARVSPARDLVFLSYSHLDDVWLQKLLPHLRPFERDRLKTFVDTRIRTGADWRREIEEALSRTKVAVLLVSSDFLASDFIAKNELPPILDAARQGGAVIHWVLVRDCNYQTTEIVKYQAAHDPSKPLARLRRPAQEKTLTSIAKGILESFTRP
jgi:TIR domain